MKTIYILAVTIILLIITSCEKVIDINLNEADQQIVVEANVYNSNFNMIHLSKSADFFDPTGIDSVKEASILITDNVGGIYTFNKVPNSNGLLYMSMDFVGTVGNEYNLEIVADGTTITANSKMPSYVPIDSVTYELLGGFGGGPPGGGQHGGGSTVQFYRAFFHFTDPVDETNYYKFNIFINGEQVPSIDVVDDRLFNGISTIMPYRTPITKQDTMVVALVSIDKQNYEYYRVLSTNDMGSMSTSIGNPESTVKGENTIGIFGAYSSDIDTLIIE